MCHTDTDPHNNNYYYIVIVALTTSGSDDGSISEDAVTGAGMEEPNEDGDDLAPQPKRACYAGLNNATRLS